MQKLKTNKHVAKVKVHRRPTNYEAAKEKEEEKISKDRRCKHKTKKKLSKSIMILHVENSSRLDHSARMPIVYYIKIALHMWIYVAKWWVTKLTTSISIYGPWVIRTHNFSVSLSTKLFRRRNNFLLRALWFVRENKGSNNKMARRFQFWEFFYSSNKYWPYYDLGMNNEIQTMPVLSSSHNGWYVLFSFSRLSCSWKGCVIYNFFLFYLFRSSMHKNSNITG